MRTLGLELEQKRIEGRGVAPKGTLGRAAGERREEQEQQGEREEEVGRKNKKEQQPEEHQA